jgi:hypothetical protein
MVLRLVAQPSGQEQVESLAAQHTGLRIDRLG